MATEAGWKDGKSELPQERASTDVEVKWADGQSGTIAIMQYTPSSTGQPAIKRWGGVPGLAISKGRW